MKFKKFFKVLWIALFIIFCIVAIYMEVVRVDNVRQLSSNELNEEAVRRIKMYGRLFNFLIVYLFFLGAYAFVSVFKLLVSPRVGGNIFKIILASALYVGSIAIMVIGYNNILNVNFFVELTGALSEPSIKTSYTHLLMLAFIGGAKYLEKSIDNEMVKNHNKDVVNSELYNRHKVLRDIIKDNSKDE